MQTALAILRRAFGLIVASPGQTLKVVAPGIAIYIASAVLGMALLGPRAATGVLSGSGMDAATGGNAAAVLLVLAGFAIGFAVFAVFWHRYALLEGAARDRIMEAGAGVMLRYLLAALIVGVVLFAVALPFGFAIGLISAALASAGAAPAMLLLTVLLPIILGFVSSWAGLRVSLILPAAALGERLSISESWAATRPVSRALWIATAMLMALNLLATLAVQVVAAGLPALGFLLAIALMLAQALVGLGVLSTLYGHCIQGRDLT